MVLVKLIYILSYLTTSDAKDIYVYGGFKPESLYESHDTTTILNQDDFKMFESRHSEDIADFIPNMSTAKGSSRKTFFQIRGIGERSSYEAVSNYSVGVIVDDIDYTGLGALGFLSGTSQIEVYRGPQSTRFGPSALAGMIHMSSMKPTNANEWTLDSQLGNFKTYNNTLQFTGALNKEWGVSISAFNNSSDGHINNSYLKRDDTNHIFENGLKVLLSKSNAKNTTDVNIHFFNTRNGYDAFVQDNSLTTQSDRLGKDKLDSFATSLKFIRDLNEKMTSTSIFTVLKSDQSYSYDEDWGNNDKWENTPGWNMPYDYNIGFNRKRDDYSFEQRFIVNTNYVFGSYLKKSKERFSEQGFNNGITRKEITGTVNTQISSLFVETKHKLTSSLTLKSGARLEYRSVDYQDQSGSELAPKDLLYGLNLSLSYEKNNKERYTFKSSKGYKAGGVNTQENVNINRKEFGGESLYSFELGHSKLWTSYNMSSQINLFYMFRDDAQVKTSFQDDPMDPSSYTFYTDNATSGHHYGLELELEKDITSKILIKTSLSFLQTKFDDYEIGGRNLKRREIPHSAEYSGYFLVSYKLNDSFSFNTNLRFSDNFYFSNSHDQKSKPYQIVDTQIIYKKNKWQLRLWAKNIFNEFRTQRGFYFSNRPPDWKEELYVQREVPRTYGISATVNF